AAGTNTAGRGSPCGEIKSRVIPAGPAQRVGQEPEALGLGGAEAEPERPLARGVVPAPACHASPFPNRAPAVKVRLGAPGGAIDGRAMGPPRMSTGGTWRGFLPRWT